MQRVLRSFLLGIPRRPALIPCNVSPLPILPRYASKKATKKPRTAAANEEDDTIVYQTKGKGKNKQQRAEIITETQLPGEKFDLSVLESNMERAIERLRVALKGVVGRVGRISPDLLDGVRVEIEGSMERLDGYASISVLDGTRMKVNLYDPTYLRQVETALMKHTVSLSPSRVDDSTIRVSIAKPDMNLRNELAKQASTLCENARTSIRAARHQGQKDIKKDENAKTVSGEEATREMKKLEDVTKAHTATVDGILNDAKKVILDD